MVMDHKSDTREDRDSFMSHLHYENTMFRQMAEDAFKALESSIALNKAYQARIKDLETALAFYKSSLETVEQTGGPCVPMCPPSICDCMGTRK